MKKALNYIVFALFILTLSLFSAGCLEKNGGNENETKPPEIIEEIKREEEDKKPISEPPVDSEQGFLTLPFNDPQVWIVAGWYYNNGVDHFAVDYVKGEFAPANNKPGENFFVIAAADGVAMQNDHGAGNFGKYVMIRHNETDLKGENYYTLYAHLDSIESFIPKRPNWDQNYHEWKEVSRGQLIGIASDTGSRGQIHLHFEVFTGKVGSDPERTQNRVDPYDIQGYADVYPRPPDVRSGSGDEHLWKIGSSNETVLGVQSQEPFSVKKVSAGSSYSLALMENGTVWSWGYNLYGQLGDGTTVTRHTPEQVIGLENIIAISAGGSHSLALKSDGTVWAWGHNNYGQLGDGTTKISRTPVKVNGLPEIVKISAGGSHSMALSSDGTVWTWGQNFTGRLGDGTIENRYQPVQVIDLHEVIDISASLHSLALKSDGTVWAWGSNYDGQLGNGRHWNNSDTPIQTININNAVAISAGNTHSLAVLSDGTVWAWGNNYNAQLGNGKTDGKQPVPEKVDGLDSVVAITARGFGTIALKSDGTAWGWGYNYYGQLGDGTADSHKTIPTRVIGLNNIKEISVSGKHSLAILADGTVWGWGFNQSGQVGDNTTIDRHKPVQTLFNFKN